MSKITAYGALSAPPRSDDELVIVDVHDTSMAATGTTKKLAVASLRPAYYGPDYGITGDGLTDCGALINSQLQAMWNGGSGAGGILDLPAGVIRTSVTLIIPPRCWLRGQGIVATNIAPVAGGTFNADTMQFETYNSSSQAAILGIAGTSLFNAFYAGLSDCTVYGNYNTGTPGASFYNHCFNATTNPLTTAAGSDPDFDPTNWIDNVQFRGASGDGLYCSGRSGLRVTRVVSRYNNGNGVTPTFDSIFTGCNFGFNGVAGAYVAHGACDGAGNKAYNNGTSPQWVSGSNYTLAQVIMYNGAVYVCKLAITGSATVPSSDTAHFTQVTAATSPQAWGYDFYFDTGTATGCSWEACDSQEPSAGSYYIKNAVGLRISGSSSQPNFNNVTGLGANSSNPSLYAAVTLDGAAGCTIDLAYDTLNSVAYAARIIGGAARNRLCLAGDTTYQAILSSDTVTLPGSGNLVSVNGSWLSMALAGAITPAIVTLADAATIAVNAALGNDFRVTLGGSRTMGTPSNPQDGQDITFLITQPASGGPYTVTWGSAYSFGTAGTPALTVTASKSDLIGFKYVAAKTAWVYMGSTLGF